MNEAELEAFITELPDVQREENFGYAFFFVGDDHRLAFVTIGTSDNDFDKVSNLNREGVFRVNIGVSKETYAKIVGRPASDDIDYSVLDVFLPHPHYARQNFLCILNPVGDNAETTKRLIEEAHSIAGARWRRKSPK